MLNKYNRQLLFYFAIFLTFAIFLSNDYRDYIYSNSINDFGIADAGGNFFVVPLLSIFLFISKPILSNTVVVLRVTFFYIITEIASIYKIIPGVFDIADLIAYLFGAIFTLLLFNRLEIRNNTCIRRVL